RSSTVNVLPTSGRKSIFTRSVADFLNLRLWTTYRLSPENSTVRRCAVVADTRVRMSVLPGTTPPEAAANRERRANHTAVLMHGRCRWFYTFGLFRVKPHDRPGPIRSARQRAGLRRLPDAPDLARPRQLLRPGAPSQRPV